MKNNDHNDTGKLPERLRTTVITTTTSTWHICFILGEDAWYICSIMGGHLLYLFGNW